MVRKSVSLSLDVRFFGLWAAEMGAGVHALHLDTFSLLVF